jgi:hypothetical protein
MVRTDHTANVTFPSGAVIIYTPDSAGRLLSAVDSNNQINYVTGATYNAPGSLTGSVYGQSASFTGIVNSFSFNNRLQPVNMWSSSPTSPTRTLMNLIYDSHAGNSDNGNVYAITNYRDQSRNQTLTCDPLNRLLSAQNTGTDCKTLPDGHTEYWANSYTYDPWGQPAAEETDEMLGGEPKRDRQPNQPVAGRIYVRYRWKHASRWHSQPQLLV